MTVTQPQGRITFALRDTKDRAGTLSLIRPQTISIFEVDPRDTEDRGLGPANPGGLPIEVFDGLRQQLAANRAQFYLDFAGGPFYSYNRPGAKTSQGVVENWWRQAMMGGAKAHYDGIKAFSETDFTEDLKVIDVPTLVMHGDDDQIVPIADSAPLSAKLLKKGTLKVYPKFPHGMCTTHANVVNPDLLAFIKN